MSSTVAAGLSVTGARAYADQYPNPAGLALATIDQRLYEIAEQQKLLKDQELAYTAMKAIALLHVCPRCKGRGWVSAPREDGDGTTSKDCPGCKGSGK